MLGEALNFINEMRPMNFQYEFLHGLVLLSFLTLVLLFGVKLRFVRAMMVVGLLFFSFEHVRGLAILSLTVPFIVAHPLQTQFPFLRPSADAFMFIPLRKFGRLAKDASRVAFTASIGLLSVAYILLWPNDSPPAGITPAAALEYASKNHISGPLLNYYNFGGYLVFRGVKTFIDGRQLLFGREFTLDAVKVSSLGGASKLEALADEYKASWTLFPPSSMPVLFLDLSPRWRRVYADDIAVIHIRR